MMASMSTARKVALVCLFSPPVLAVIGCGSVVPPEVSGGMKVLANKMNTLTGTEIQAMAGAANIPLTIDQANVIAEFLADNDIASMADVEALIVKFQQDPTSVKLPGGFFDLFKNFQLPTQST